MPSFVAYYRVSTERQGRSGLGLDAQRQAVHSFIQGDLVGEFVEVESGKVKDRPELMKALHLAKQTRSTLVIAKLDRLARNVAFIANLMDAGVEFVAVDMPTANRLTIHILAAVAEHEREMISARTKAALAAAKARGVRLGNPNGARALKPTLKEAQAAGAETNKVKADEFAKGLVPVIAELKANGIDGVRPITRALNERGIKTQGGGIWHPTAVARLLDRMPA